MRNSSTSIDTALEVQTKDGVIQKCDAGVDDDDNDRTGGTSVIYADTVGDLGFASELGNYAEYSRAPKEDEVLQYARVVRNN